MATIVHFDIPAEDIERAKKFYSELFSWDIKKVPGFDEGDMEYRSVETADDSGKKGLAGGIGKKRDPQQQIVNYIGVSSIDEYMKKVEESGGKLISQKQAVPGVGYLAVCMDTENNPFGLWQDDKNAK